ncbi:MAG: hypothetical protein H0U73_01475, partial [Tatlockia sp.]|nr:hypothetical protein [Tatlockia sp.]
YIVLYPHDVSESKKLAREALEGIKNKLDTYGLIDEDYGQNIYYGDPDDIDKFFVMQFFRHIEKFPKLSEKIYAELNTLSNEGLSVFLNQVGKQLTHGSELNFKRSIYLPIDCLTKFEYLRNFDAKSYGSEYSSHSANQFFRNEKLGPYSLHIHQVLEWLEKDDYTNLMELKENIKQLFESIRFIRYLLKHCTAQTKTHAFLEEEFNRCYLRETSQNESRPGF